MTEEVKELTEFDPQLFASAFLRGEEYELIDLQDSLGKELTALFNKVAKLPNPNDAKIVAAFTLLPSILCKVVPILVLRGAPGSGKSQILTTMARLLDTATVAGNSTAASIKNHINRLRWADPQALTHERNTHLLLDNCNADTFDSPDILGAFLNGYSRETDRQYISGGKGENIEFRVFCPKAITTVWDLESQEMLRRVLMIRTKKSRDLEGMGDEIPEFPSLKKELSTFWKQRDNCEAFVILRRSAALKWKKLTPVTKEQLHLVADLIAAGLVASVWDTPEEALAQFASLFHSNASRSTLLESVIVDALEAITGLKRTQWGTLPPEIKIEVTPKALKVAIDAAVADGLIQRPSLVKVQDLVGANGFAPHRSVAGIVYHYKGG